MFVLSHLTRPDTQQARDNHWPDFSMNPESWYDYHQTLQAKTNKA